jgi:nicotinamide riboside transporter PnuC
MVASWVEWRAAKSADMKAVWKVLLKAGSTAENLVAVMVGMTACSKAVMKVGC